MSIETEDYILHLFFEELEKHYRANYDRLRQSFNLIVYNFDDTYIRIVYLHNKNFLSVQVAYKAETTYSTNVEISVYHIKEYFNNKCNLLPNLLTKLVHSFVKDSNLLLSKEKHRIDGIDLVDTQKDLTKLLLDIFNVGKDLPIKFKPKYFNYLSFNLGVVIFKLFYDSSYYRFTKKQYYNHSN